jgi:hypothetical protein
MSARNLCCIDLAAIVIANHDPAVFVAADIVGDLPRHLFRDILRLVLAVAIHANRILERKTIDNFKMIFRHLQPPSSGKAMPVPLIVFHMPAGGT